MKQRNLDYEKKFRKYLYSFDFETHKKICLNIGLNYCQNNNKDKNKLEVD